MRNYVSMDARWFTEPRDLLVTGSGSWGENWTSGRQNRKSAVPGACHLVLHNLKWFWTYKEFIIDVFGGCLYWIQADSFQRQGRQLRRKMWLQSLQMKLMIGGGIFALIVILWLIACGGFKCWGARASILQLDRCLHLVYKMLLFCRWKLMQNPQHSRTCFVM